MKNRSGSFRWAIAAGLAAACGCNQSPRSGSFPEGVLIVLPDDADELDQRLADDTKDYLATILDDPVGVVEVPDEHFDSLEDITALAKKRRAGLVVVLRAEQLATEQVGDDRIEALGDSGFVVEAHEVGDWNNRLDSGEPGATVVLTAGGTRLARQYGAYELLRRLGVRFFHPEQEYVPRHAAADVRALSRRPTLLHREGRDYVPDFAWRSWSFHSSHPLEHLEAFSDPDHPIDEAVAVNDWVVKNFGNRFRGAGRGAVSPEQREIRVQELEQWRDRLGFDRGTGISLHNLQQGASAEIDPDSPVPVQTQIETLVEQKLRELPDAQWFGIHFGPTEFSTTPDEQTVQWIDWAGQAALRLRPDLLVEINNHITGSQPSPNYDDLGCPNGTNDDGRIDYYDLAFHTDPRFAIRVHTVMFHPLEGPARVYNQQSFEHKRCLMEHASAQGRPIQWFPEGAWWLSYDNSVPMYLPLYMSTRAQDIELLRPLLVKNGGTLDGHRMFDTGHEWGYWQQDYAVGLLSWNTDVTLPQVLGELFDPLCAPEQWREGCDAKRESIAVLTEMMDHQREWFLEREDWQGRPGGLYSYFAGEDEGDVLAAASGLEFRPVRVPFSEVLTWEPEQLEHFRATDLAAIEEAAAAYEGWLVRLSALVPAVPDDGQPWLAEVIDGVEIDALRGRQAAALYDAVLLYREAQLSGNPPHDAAYPRWLDALEAVADAQRVITRREASYRYPAEQTHGGGLTEATAVDNGTTYGYRVHTKTHLLTYWLNRQAEVTQILVGESGGDPAALSLREAIDGVGAPVAIEWPELSGLGGSVDFGGERIEAPTDTFDPGAAPGYWPVSVEVTHDGPTLTASGAIVRSDVRAGTPAQGMTLLEPEDPAAQGVLSSVLPAMRWAWLDEPAALAFAPDADADGSVAYTDVVYAPVVSGDATGFSTARVEFELPVALSAGGTPLFITVTDAELSGQIVGQAIDDPLILSGQLSVDDIVVAAIELAGFDEAGTIGLLADVWGFDPQDPPQWVPITAELAVQP